VAALAIVKEKQFPTLNSILFGEGVVNDAAAILIYQAVITMIESSGSDDGDSNNDDLPITAKLIGLTVWNFIYISALSILLGMFFGLISAFVSKFFTSFKESPPKEVFLILLFSYLSYILSEIWGLSAIMTLFVCGVTMSHYTFHNISSPSQNGSVMAINTFGHMAEAFLFIYLGIGIYTTDQETFNLNFTLLIILGGCIARAAAVFIPLGIFACIKKFKISINFKQMVIIWFSGLIRGAIAFALSLKIDGNIAPHKEALISITLIVVLMTTIILGGLMAAFAKLIGLSVESNTESHDFVARSSMIEGSSRKTALERKDAGWLQKKWRYLDNQYLKKLFGGDLGGKKHILHKELKEGSESVLPAFGEFNYSDKSVKNGGENRSTRVQKFDDILRNKEDSDGEEEEKYVANKLQ
jgi:NhaP-type Na+/H+ or K+/H+ antiporter